MNIALATQRSTISSGIYSKKPKRLEKSYTIQFGAQSKSTHNLSLIHCNNYDLCKDRFTIDENAGGGGGINAAPDKKSYVNYIE